MYKDMQKYGVENFQLTILCEVEPEQLTVMEQKMIEELCPTYNNYYANGHDIERYKETIRKYEKEYRQSENGKEVHRKYRQSEKGKEYNRKQARKDMKKYRNQLCSYKGEVITLGTLSARFRKVGIDIQLRKLKNI